MTGERVALSGAIHGISRSEFRARLETSGFQYVATLDEDVHVLVVGDSPLPSKVTRAEALDVDVVSWATFQRRLDAPADSVPLIDSDQEDVAVHAAIETSPDHLRVLDVLLARPAQGADHHLVPALEDFDHYTLDSPTLGLLRFIARAASLAQPCLLEGDTATSKTSAVRYLAAHLGQPLVRLNLNGQTDTSELVGRFVPDGEGWRFQEGLVPQAMRRGWWVVLDEVNLAEPAVLERLNPVLERHSSLVLTEGDGVRIGAGGAPVHPSFRIFATMNPADYQGRSVLSPAWRDRFVATWQASAPGELEFRQMLRRLVFGIHPQVDASGHRWQGPHDAAPPFARLSEVEGVEGLLARLASVHAAVIAMSSPTEGQPASLGSRRRERYMFSRRGLLSLLDALQGLQLAEPDGTKVDFVSAPARVVLDALDVAYIDRLRGDEDRGRVRNVLRTMGLVRDGWVDPFSGAV